MNERVVNTLPAKPPVLSGKFPWGALLEGQHFEYCAGACNGHARGATDREHPLAIAEVALTSTFPTLFLE